MRSVLNVVLVVTSPVGGDNAAGALAPAGAPTDALCDDLGAAHPTGIGGDLHRSAFTALSVFLSVALPQRPALDVIIRPSVSTCAVVTSAYPDSQTTLSGLQIQCSVNQALKNVYFDALSLHSKFPDPFARGPWKFPTQTLESLQIP